MRFKLLFSCLILSRLVLAQPERKTDETTSSEGEVESRNLDSSSVDSRIENSPALFKEMGIGRGEAIPAPLALKLYVTTLSESLNEDADLRQRWARYFELTSEQVQTALQLFSEYLSSYANLNQQKLSDACAIYYDLSVADPVSAHDEAFQLMDSEPPLANSLNEDFYREVSSRLGKSFHQRFSAIAGSAQNSFIVNKGRANAWNQAKGVSDSDYFAEVCK